MSLGLEPKRRACLALAAKLEHAKAAGVKTLTPELVLSWLAAIAEQPAPEAACQPAEQRRFLAACTMGELTWLLEQYEKAGLVDLRAGTERMLAGRMTA